MTTEYVSPDGRHTLRLIEEGEIRFGPMYFTPALDGKHYPDIIMGDCCAWSPDSRHLALQEWLTTDYGAGPVTRAKIIDLEKRVFYDAYEAQKAFVENFAFTGEEFSYDANYQGLGKKVSYSISFGDIRTWKPLGTGE